MTDDIKDDESISSQEVLDGVFDEKTEDTETETVEQEAEEAEETSDSEEESDSEETEPSEDDEQKGDKEQDSEPPAEPEEDTEQDSKSVPVAALKNERLKRQQAEEQLKQYQQKYDKDEQAPDPVEDPEGYKAYVKQQAKDELVNERIETSRNEMLAKHKDYEKMELAFATLKAQDESLHQQMLDHPKPAEFAYKKAKEYYKSIRDEVEKEILAKMQTKVDTKEETEAQKRKKSAVEMPNLTQAASKGSNSTPVEQEVGLNDMFSDQTY